MKFVLPNFGNLQAHWRSFERSRLGAPTHHSLFLKGVKVCKGVGSVLLTRACFGVRVVDQEERCACGRRHSNTSHLEVILWQEAWCSAGSLTQRALLCTGCRRLADDRGCVAHHTWQLERKNRVVSIAAAWSSAA
eukprot:6193751-Pleurochrysis_carterae.AAC.2